MDNKTGGTRSQMSRTPPLYRPPKHSYERQAQVYQHQTKSPNNPQKNYYSNSEYYHEYKTQTGKRHSFQAKHVQEESDSDFEDDQNITQPSRRNTGVRKDLNRSEVMSSSFMEDQKEENQYRKTASVKKTMIKEDQSGMKKATPMLFKNTTSRYQSYLAGEEAQLKLLTREPLEKYRDCKTLYSSALKVTEDVIYKYETHDLKEFTHITNETQQLSLRAKKVQKIK